MMTTESSVLLKDGSKITLRLEWPDIEAEAVFPTRSAKRTYLHNDVEISVEGAEYLAATIGIERTA